MKVAKVTTRPAKYPVLLEQQKGFSRIDTVDDDHLIDGFIGQATDYVEEYVGRSFISREMTLFLDSFSTGAQRKSAIPFSRQEGWWDGVRTAARNTITTFNGDQFIELTKGPLLSVTQVSTFDEDDAETVYTASNYYVDTESVPGRIVLRSSSIIPTAIRDVNGIKVVYKSGYGEELIDIPEQLRLSIMMTANTMYEQRGDEPDMNKAFILSRGVRQMLTPFVLEQDIG